MLPSNAPRHAYFAAGSINTSLADFADSYALKW